MGRAALPGGESAPLPWAPGRWEGGHEDGQGGPGSRGLLWTQLVGSELPRVWGPQLQANVNSPPLLLTSLCSQPGAQPPAGPRLHGLPTALGRLKRIWSEPRLSQARGGSKGSVGDPCAQRLHERPSVPPGGAGRHGLPRAPSTRASSSQDFALDLQALGACVLSCPILRGYDPLLPPLRPGWTLSSKPANCLAPDSLTSLEEPRAPELSPEVGSAGYRWGADL